MKKYITLCSVLILAILSTGCSDDENTSKKVDSAKINQISDQKISNEIVSTKKSPKNSMTFDFDLSSFSDENFDDEISEIANEIPKSPTPKISRDSKLRTNNISKFNNDGDNNNSEENNEDEEDDDFYDDVELDDSEEVTSQKLSQAITKNIDCNAEYEKLLAVNSFDFSRCTTVNIRDGKYTEQPLKEDKKSIVLIFDASGSMAAKIGTKTRMEVAQEAVQNFLKTLDGDQNISLSIVIYGHKGSNAYADKAKSCAGVDEVQPLKPIQGKAAQIQIASLKPTGWTPIAIALKKAEKILYKSKDQTKFILLVSDGKESCDGDPISTVKQIKKNNQHIKINVIGLEVEGESANQLSAIAKAGDGIFYSVKNIDEFKKALQANKQMLQKVNYAIGRSVQQIYDISFLTNTYYQCLSALQREKTVMKIDLYAKDIISKQCKSEIDKKYQARYNKINKIILNNYKKGKQEFNQTATKIFDK
jgi:Mg-chelatase subunit ChlD